MRPNDALNGGYGSVKAGTSQNLSLPGFPSRSLSLPVSSQSTVLGGQHQKKNFASAVDSEQLVVNISNGLLEGNRFMLSKAITMSESTREDHRQMAMKILNRTLQARAAENDKSGKSTLRIGISGPPGVGKSSFIEVVGQALIKQGESVAVIAVDPSSYVSGGSILGDKTRMSDLSVHENAYVRPCATGGHLGGLAQHTDEIVSLCEAAGYSTVIIETVGVGQSEILVTQVADMCVLLLPPAGGDELQGIKRGIVETADLVVINKADGDLLLPAKRAQAEYRMALQVVRGAGRPRNWWYPEVITCSTKMKEGIDEVLTVAGRFQELANEQGELQRRRGEQRSQWMWRKAEEDLVEMLRSSAAAKAKAASLQAELARSAFSPRVAALELLNSFLSESKAATK